MKVEFIAGSKAKVTFDITNDKFREALDKAFEKTGKNVTIPGFRKGHVTREIFNKKFGEAALYETALDVLCDEYSKEVFSDKELGSRVISQLIPNIEGTIDSKDGFKLTFTFDVFPTDFEVGAYKGVEVAKKNTEVTEEEVEGRIDSILKSKGTISEKAEQVVSKGDTANFDFEGFVDGVAFEGGAAKGYEMEIGSGQFIPGFEDQMIGMKSGETKDVNVTFPTPYAAKELEGKAAVFKVTINSVKENKLPELNDEFVVTLNKDGIKTVDELKSSIKDEIKASKEENEKNRQIDEVVNKILDGTKVELPQSMIDNFTNDYKKRYEDQAKAYNIPLETLLQLSGTTLDAFNENARKIGERQALFQVVLDKVAFAEKLQPTDEELNARAEEIAKQINSTKDEVLKTRFNQIVSEHIYNKFIDLVMSNAKEI